MSRTDATRRPRRWLRRTLLGLLAVVLAAAALVALASWPPAGYVNPVPSEDLLVSAHAFELKLQDLFNARLSKMPVHISFTADEVNGYCAALQDDNLWRQLRLQDVRQRERYRPKGLTGVRVRFQKNEAWITGRMPQRWLPEVLSVRVRPQVDTDDTLVFAVTGVKLGHLPIPKALARRWFGHISDTVFPQDDSWLIKHMGISGGRLYVWAGPIWEE